MALVPEMIRDDAHEEQPAFALTNPSPMGGKFDLFSGPSPFGASPFGGGKFELPMEYGTAPSGLMTPNTSLLMSLLQSSTPQQANTHASPFAFSAANHDQQQQQQLMLSKDAAAAAPVTTAGAPISTSASAAAAAAAGGMHPMYSQLLQQQQRLAAAQAAVQPQTQARQHQMQQLQLQQLQQLQHQHQQDLKGGDVSTDDMHEDEESHDEEDEDEMGEEEHGSDSEASFSPRQQALQSGKGRKGRKRKATQPLGGSARTFEELSDDQIAFMDFKELMKLMVAAGLSRQDIAETKARRRRLKNRQSARLCSNKKREMCNELSSKNQQLHDTIDRMQKEIERLKKENMMLKQQMR